jgi:hypothetical protein
MKPKNSSPLRSFYGQGYSAQVPKGFSVRIFKGPTLSSYSSTGEPKFDVGYRPHPASNSWQKSNMSTSQTRTKPPSPTHDAPRRNSRLFGNSTNAGHLHQTDCLAPSNYSIYPSLAKDIFVYERSICSKSETYSESDTASDSIFSPSSYFSTALSNDSTITLQSTALTESLLGDSYSKPSTLPSTQQFSPVQFPPVARAMSNANGRVVDAAHLTTFYPLTAETVVRLPSSSGLDRETSGTTTASGQPEIFYDYSASIPSQNSNPSAAYPSYATRGDTERVQPSENSQARTNSDHYYPGRTARSRVDAENRELPHNSRRNEGERHDSRTSFVPLPSHRAGPSDGYLSTTQGDIYSISATKGSSPPGRASQTHSHIGNEAFPARSHNIEDVYIPTSGQPTVDGQIPAGAGYRNSHILNDRGDARSITPHERDGLETFDGVTQIITNSEFISDHTCVSSSQAACDGQGSRITSAATASPNSRPFSRLSRVDTTTTAAMRAVERPAQTTSPLRESNSRRDSRPLSSLPSDSRASNGLGERYTHSFTRPDAAEISPATLTKNNRGARDSFIESGQYSGNRNDSRQSSYYPATQERSVRETSPPIETRPSTRRQVRGEPLVESSRDAPSLAAPRGDQEYVQPSHLERALDNQHFAVTNSSINSNVEHHSMPYTTRRGSEERPRSVAAPRPSSVLPGQYSHAAGREEGRTVAYSASSTVDPPRRQESMRGLLFSGKLDDLDSSAVSASPPSRNDVEYHFVPPPRRSSNERQDARSNSVSPEARPSYRHETQTNVNRHSISNPPLDESTFIPPSRGSSDSQHYFRFLQPPSEPQRSPEETDNIGFRSTTPGGTRSVRWNPNLIAPSPIFASQRRKGWFNRRGYARSVCILDL